MAELKELVPAEVLLVVKTASEEEARVRGEHLGWASREYGGLLTFLVPKRISIPEAVRALNGVPLTSLSLREIALEHVYFEVTRLRQQGG